MTNDRRDEQELMLCFQGDAPEADWMRAVANALFDGERRAVRHEGVKAWFARSGRVVGVTANKEEMPCE